MPSNEHAKGPRFVVVTGLSGSGKTTALRALEDLGFYAVDNLPLSLLPAFLHLPVESLGRPFKAALVMDVRSPGFIKQFPQSFKGLLKKGYNIELFFLEASDGALVRRFSETRRAHPLSDQGWDIHEAIIRERELMAPIRDMANQAYDTSRLNGAELRAEIAGFFKRGSESGRVQLNIMSFGYKYGLPLEADLAIDVRFLANPYYIEELRPLDGRDSLVVEYVFGQEISLGFMEKYKELLLMLIPHYQKQGKSQITLAVGCTGGKHRSVAVSERLAHELRGEDFGITVRHRDIESG